MTRDINWEEFFWDFFASNLRSAVMCGCFIFSPIPNINPVSQPVGSLWHTPSLTCRLWLIYRDKARSLLTESKWECCNLQFTFTLKDPVQRAVWPPEQLCREQAHPKSNSALPKSCYGEPTGLHHHYRLPSDRRKWESKKVTERGKEEEKEVWLQLKFKEKKPPPQQPFENTMIICRKVLFCSPCFVVQTQVPSSLMLSTGWSRSKRLPWKYTQKWQLKSK